MLYSIVPPILVIVSVVGIILFLTKKAPDVAALEENEKRTEMVSGNKVRMMMNESLKQKLFLVLEKGVRKSRVIFLKLENMFTAWSNSLRNKRKGILDRKELPEEKDDVLEKLKNYEVNQVSDPVYPSGSNLNKTEEIAPAQAERVMRQRVATSRKRVKPEPKNHLEQILIERIAANPRDVEAYERLGEYYFEIENYTDAKECFKQVVKLDPSNYNVKMKMKRLERLLAR